MSEYTYTAEDFEQAHFAIDPSASGFGQGWVRCADGRYPWYNPDKHEWASARGMALAGCIPVYAEPYSPEALQRAWEHGEKPKPDEKTTEGMVTASAVDGAFGKTLAVHANQAGGPLFSFERIIYRPPEPDPVADLTAVLHGWHDRFKPEELAEFLHKHGVKVVTDDE